MEAAAGDYLLVGGVAFVAVLLATPLVGFAARRFGAVAVPGERHVHQRVTPTLGGVALLVGLLAAVGVASQRAGFSDVFLLTREPEAIILASAFIVLIGVVDDTRGLSAPAKVAGQIFAGALLVNFGVALQYIWLPGEVGTIVLDPNWQAVLTVAAAVAMMNAVNLVDGLDGLAAGVVAIAAGALFVYTQLAQELGDVPSAGPLFLVAIVGVCLGFLVHNFNPASIFMGDTGAMLLGLLLAGASVSAVGSAFQAPSGGTFAALSIPVLVPVLVLAVPFGDTIWTILRRLASGRAIFSPDKQHLHHRLLEIGHSHRRAVLIMYYWSALLAFAAVGISQMELPVLAAWLGAGVGLALLVAIGSRIARRLAVQRLR
jgi:UDP-GlcNAc:undecaprenyl-phosphate/decaprenyl-phosphate GlcNAc-1-phosphate transferase